MSAIYTNVNKPNAKYPIQNYFDHVVFLIHKYRKENQELGLLRTKNFNETCELMTPLALKRLSFFQPLRDGHDYTDEVMGVLITPALLLASLTMLIKSMYHGVASLLASLTMLIKSTYHGVASWMPNNAYMKKDKHKHAGESADKLHAGESADKLHAGESAGNLHAGESADNLYVACLTLFIAINNCLISAASLVTRPIATTVYGFEEQNTPRFRV